MMDFNPIEERRPKTLFVLMLLSMAALVFSYLYAYCLTDALVAAEVMTPVSSVDNDPRPRTLMVGWIVLMITFGLLGWVMNRLSASEMRSLDELSREQD
ncbi:MAG TPA: hypothetical protein PLD59_15460 [Tepidisphaeraceae bacterium]|nr:hypothetical protein [Tepidisphaeraceae bacterium]